MDEFSLIQTYFAPLAAGQPGAVGLTDDTATLAPDKDHDLVITTDCLVADVHFLANDRPEDVAAKALRVNLSDLASAGASPRAYSLALALSPNQDTAWVARFAAELGREQNHFGIGLIGGDTVSTPGPLTVTMTAMGQVPSGTALRRGKARAGDRIFVSGPIGGGALGLACAQGRLTLETDTERAALNHFWRPEPRLALGELLRGRATAAADVSDGLVADLGHICESSGLWAEVQLENIPLFDGADALDPIAMITGGDDYELVFTVSPDIDAAEIHGWGTQSGTVLSEIGVMAKAGCTSPPTQGNVTVLSNGTAIAVERTGYRHDHRPSRGTPPDQGRT